MNEKLPEAPKPLGETPKEQTNAGTGILQADMKDLVETTEKENPALAKAFANVSDADMSKAPEPFDKEGAIKGICIEAYSSILALRGPGAWEAEFHHAAAVAQTF